VAAWERSVALKRALLHAPYAKLSRKSLEILKSRAYTRLLRDPSLPWAAIDLAPALVAHRDIPDPDKAIRTDIWEVLIQDVYFNANDLVSLSAIMESRKVVANLAYSSMISCLPCFADEIFLLCRY
jgi:hypothetical protein